MPAMSVTIPAQLLSRAGETIPIQATLAYSVHTPFIVNAEFECAGQTATWELSRDLLAEAMESQSGSGDVCAWTADTDDGFYLRLSSPEGLALLKFDTDDIGHFLAATQDICPDGFEAINWDDVVAEMLEN